MNAFPNQRKWCPGCEAYVTYLQSNRHAYCTVCDSQVRLFSEPVVPEYRYTPIDVPVVEDVRRYTDEAVV